MDFVAYHDRTSADHQAHFDDLFPKGWRMTILSVYGARGDERYAAVWVLRSRGGSGAGTRFAVLFGKTDHWIAQARTNGASVSKTNKPIAQDSALPAGLFG